MSTIEFDFCRIGRSKKEVDVTSNTIRKIHEEFGLNLYRMGRMTFFSKAELAAIMRTRGLVPGANRTLPS
jgi:hypothetical protein